MEIGFHDTEELHVRGVLALALGALVAATPGCRDESVATAPAAAAAPSEGARLAAQGEALFYGRAGCHTCHSVGARGTQLTGPNLGVSEDFPKPLAQRAAERRPGLTPLEYALESLVDPDAFVVPTYAPGVMKRPEEPPIALSEDELLAVATYVASIGAAPPSDAELAEARANVGALHAARSARLAQKR